MKTLLRHKTFIKDMRNFRLTEIQATKLLLYVASLLNDEPLPPEAKDHALQGEWSDFRELHLGGDSLLNQYSVSIVMACKTIISQQSHSRFPL